MLNFKNNILYLRNSISKAGPIFAVIILSIFLSIVTDNFFSFANFMNILKQTTVNSLVAFGMLLIILTGGIDLSVGSIVAISACMMGVFLKAGVNSPFILIVICLVTGISAGTINALLYTKLNLPHPFISTLATMQIYRGIALIITGAAPITGFPEGVTYLGFISINQIPLCFIVVILMLVIFSILLNKTALGRKIYTVGGNPEAALLSGINVKAVHNFVYIVCGVMCAVAALILTGRVGTAFPLSGEDYAMDAIASCVIGGASFSGGKGTISGTLVGALLIQMMRNGLNLLGAQSDIQMVVIGVVIIFAVYIDVLKNSSEEKAKRLARAKSNKA